MLLEPRVVVTDAPQAATFYQEPKGGWPAPGPPWLRRGQKLHQLLEQWRREREQQHPGFLWLRYLRPHQEQLGSALRRVLHGHNETLCSIDVSSDGTRLVSADWDGSVRVWDLHSGTELASADYADHRRLAGEGVTGGSATSGSEPMIRRSSQFTRIEACSG